MFLLIFENRFVLATMHNIKNVHFLADYLCFHFKATMSFMSLLFVLCQLEGQDFSLLKGSADRSIRIFAFSLIEALRGRRPTDQLDLPLICT